ncbi:MAG: mycoredoxin [Abditibacteriota bacterium]|nr:mycoredoxin [Abditibacteriota bacterium]
MGNEAKDGEVNVYGSNWCGYTIMAIRQLDEWGVNYNYIDVDADPAVERKIADWNNGRSIRPTIEIGGDVWVNPAPRQLRTELETRGLLPEAT